LDTLEKIISSKGSNFGMVKKPPKG